MQKRVLPL
uniref:Uncharacterized protein n=1 Tax=Rhizophora mucronata TaxID=61149 RepID=A0A2P2KGR9_RHIMU